MFLFKVKVEVRAATLIFDHTTFIILFATETVYSKLTMIPKNTPVDAATWNV